MATTPLTYLMHELGLTAALWTPLSQKDKDDLKKWAADEMKNLSIA